MSFSQFKLDPLILGGVDSAGYNDPTPIQIAAIPEVLAGRDVMGIAQTGTGKTAAFMLPIMQRLLKKRPGVVRALILAPTRELAEQIHQSNRVYGSATKLRSLSVYGGVGKRQQAEKLRRGVEIVVACPGRLLDIYDDGDIDLSQIETLVMDEADRMCDMGFLPDIRRILSVLPTERQTLFFSATMPREIRSLADSILVDPVRVDIGNSAPAATVNQSLYPITEALKRQLLEALLRETDTGLTLIFTRTKDRASWLATALKRAGFSVTELQGDMPQGRRQAAIDGFRKGKHDILVATDIAARGIDVVGIGTVINFDMPNTLEGYTHRIGRTGRALRSGEAVTLATVADTPLVQEIQSQLGAPLEQRTLPGFDYGSYTPQLYIAPRPVRRSSGRGGLGSRR